MPEQGDWHGSDKVMSQKTSSPAQQKKKPAASSISAESGANRQFVGTSINQSFPQKNDARQPEPAAKSNLIKKAAAPTALKNDTTIKIYDVNRTVPLYTGRKSERDSLEEEFGTVEDYIKCVVVIAIIILFFSFFAFLIKKIPRELNPKYIEEQKQYYQTHVLPTTYKYRTLMNTEDIVHRLALMELKTESQINELTQMIIKLSSSGASFYTNNPRSGSETAVEGPREDLPVEARTGICQPLNWSQDLIPASPQCDMQSIVDGEFFKDTKESFRSTGTRGDEDEDEAATSSGVLSEMENNVGNDESGGKNSKLYDLQDRIAVLEHDMGALHSLLSTSRDESDEKTYLGR